MAEQSFFSASQPQYRIAVIGAGITGLACAFRIQERSAQSNRSYEMTVFEASDRSGGKLLTEHVDGFIVDAGPDVFMARKAGAVDLCRAVGIDDRLQETDPSTRKTYLRKDGALHPITMYDSEPLATFVSGIQTLADAVDAALPAGTVRKNTSITSITRDGSVYQLHTQTGEPYLADAVVIALPASQTAKLLEALIPDADRYFDGVSYTKTTTVSAGYRSHDVPHSLHGYGYIIQNAQLGQVSACTWSSSKIRGRAPLDHVLIRAFIRSADISADDARALALEEFRNTLGITADPLFTRAYAWPEAIPVYTKEHGERITELEATLEPFVGLTIAGSAIGATGIPDSIRSGMTAADSMWDYGMTAHWSAPRLRDDATVVAEAQSFFAR